MQKIKMNVPVRMKNPWFWVGIVGIILTAMGVSPEMLNSWEAVLNALKDLFSNPYMLASVVCAVLGVFVDPTTANVGDSDLALTYTEPKKESGNDEYNPKHFNKE